VAVLRDVTEPRRLEALLRDEAREAEANSRAKSAFLATMSHELRTPLNAVIGFANVLRKNTPGNLAERDLDYLGRIVANGRHLLSVIEDILDLSKIEAGRLEVQLDPVPVGELVDEVVSSLELQAQRRGIGLRAEVVPGLVELKTDRQRLRQILLNLMGNAVKFTGEGGVTVRVLGETGEAPSTIEVEDTGMGIPAEYLATIFEPFRQVDDSTTRSFGGAGLGLSISQSLCQLLGYQLAVRSEPGKGSVFTVHLSPPPAGISPAEAGVGNHRGSPSP
jgi:signal transduction histidine kinase